MSKNIQTYNSVVQTINDCLYRFSKQPFSKLPNSPHKREIVIYCTYSSLDDYYIGCGWRFVGEKNSCTVYYVLKNDMWCNFTEQMYKDIQLELELKLKEALVENRKKELEQDFENGT